MNSSSSIFIINSAIFIMDTGCSRWETNWKYVHDLNQLSTQSGVEVIRDNVLHIKCHVTLRQTLDLIKM